MLTSPEVLSREQDDNEVPPRSLGERLDALFGRSTARAPVLDISRLSDRMIRDLNLPEEFRPDRTPRGRP